MIIDAKLLESISSVRTKILNALIQDIGIVLNKSIPTIDDGIKNIITDAIKNEPEYYSLTNGELRYEFGIADTSSVDKVISMVVNSSKIQKKPLKFSNAGIQGGLYCTMMGRADIDNAINSSPGTVLDTSKIYVLPWLKWLLLEGTRPIVRNFEVQLGPNPNSRTGYAVMVESEGDNWGVPAEFAGTQTNNWLTRSVSRCEKQILSLIEKTIVSNI